MPELPEVETTRAGIAPHVIGQAVVKVVVRNAKLRYPVPDSLEQEMVGQCIESVHRRGKYLLLKTLQGTAMIHLGMSGSLRIVDTTVAAEKHDHVDIVLANGQCLRLHDPRRFGSVLWEAGDVMQHKLLVSLGPEPLSDEFDLDYLFRNSRKRTQAVKLFVMDSHRVVGVGNIYANEALFMAGLRPTVPAGEISRKRYQVLVTSIKEVLTAAIAQGGTTLKDFVDGSGKPGYFQQQLNVYGRAGEPCHVCGKVIEHIKLGQRATYYCPRCQP